MGSHFIVEAWTELAIAILVILLRLYSSFIRGGFREMKIDDYLMILVGIFYAGETTAAHFVVAKYRGMANNNVLPELRATLDPNSWEWHYTVDGSKAHIIGWFMYICLFWTLKSCWTLYYTRLTRNVHRMNHVINLAWGLHGITFIVAICMVVFKCWPLHRQWQINPDPGNNCYPGASKLQIIVVMAINTITDLYLMWIPVVLRVRRNPKYKIFLIVLLSGGGIVIVFGILRCVSLVSVAPTQPSESGQWSVRESFLAVVISNCAPIFPLFKHWFYTLTGKVSTHGKSSKAATYPLGSVEMDGRSKQTGASSSRRFGNHKSRKFPHPLSLPQDTYYGSEEAIMVVEENGTATKFEDGRCRTGLDAVHVTSENEDAKGQDRMTSSKNCHNQGLGNIKITTTWDIERADQEDGTITNGTSVGYQGPRNGTDEGQERQMGGARWNIVD